MSDEQEPRFAKGCVGRFCEGIGEEGGFSHSLVKSVVHVHNQFFVFAFPGTLKTKGGSHFATFAEFNPSIGNPRITTRLVTGRPVAQLAQECLAK